MRKILYTTTLPNGRPDWENVCTTAKAARQHGDGRMVKIRAEAITGKQPCPECYQVLGHHIGCKTGNDRAKAAQSALSKKWRSLSPAERRAKTRELDRRLRP